jgi:CDGSH-type Zn-finger protein
MSQPLIGDRKPKAVTLTRRGAYAWRARGRSKNQPHCDGTRAKLPKGETEAPAARIEASAPRGAATPEEPAVERIHELARDLPLDLPGYPRPR